MFFCLRAVFSGAVLQRAALLFCKTKRLASAQKHIGGKVK